MRVEQCPPVHKNLHLSQKHCEHFLRNRRSIRIYKNKSVPRKEVTRLIETARYAPSGYNSQCVEWLVLDKKDDLLKLGEVAIEWMHQTITTKPDFPLSKPIANALKRWGNGTNVISRGAPVIIITHAEKGNMLAPTSCTIALTYMELAATSMGLGCCWASYLNAAANEHPPMAKALSLPEGHQCFGAMMVGYPKLTFYRLPLRKNPKITWFS
jgi:nitroreductase